MQEIIVVNPSKRPSQRRKASRSAAQKRATANLVRMNKARKGASTMSRAKRKTNPAKRRTSRARRPNPAPLRARSRRVRRNPARRVHRRRRNPIGLNAGKPMQLLTPALVGALGATAVNTVFNNVAGVLPASLNTGNMSYVTKAALALGLAYLGGKGSKRAMFMQMAEGSLTVTIHDAIVALSGGMGMSLGAYMPGLIQRSPNAYGRPAAQMNGMSAYLTGGGSPQQRQIQASRQAAIAAKPRQMSGFGF
jgi:hypothetical protein